MFDFLLVDSAARRRPIHLSFARPPRTMSVRAIALFSSISLMVPVLAACSASSDNSNQSAAGGADAATSPNQPPNTPPPAPTREAGAPPADACETFVEGAIAWESRCHRAPPMAADVLARKKSRDHSACEHTLAEPGTSFTASFARDCGAAMSSDAASCDVQLAACTLPSGTLAEGATCSSNADCRSSYCKSAVSTESVPTARGFCGVCAPRGAAGAACTGWFNAHECDANTTCDTSQLKCAPLRDSGAACSFSAACKPGLVCLGHQKCGAPQPAGADCGLPEECATGLTCVAGSCAPRQAAGAACVVASECSVGTTCIAKKCAAPLPEGGTCTRDAECQVGLSCGLAHKCVARKFAKGGEKCDKTTVCELVDGCPFDPTTGTGTCPTVLPDGTACDPSSLSTTCDFDARCLDRKCQMFDPSVCK